MRTQQRKIDGEHFVLHKSKNEQPVKLWIPFHKDWYWGTMEVWGNYVSNGIGIIFIKESYQEFWRARCDAYNRYHKLGNYMK